MKVRQKERLPSTAGQHQALTAQRAFFSVLFFLFSLILQGILSFKKLTVLDSSAGYEFLTFLFQISNQTRDITFLKP